MRTKAAKTLTLREHGIDAHAGVVHVKMVDAQGKWYEMFLPYDSATAMIHTMQSQMAASPPLDTKKGP